MKKLKIAIIGSRGYPYVYSGYETLVKELSERLVNKGHTVRVYCHRYLFKHRPKNLNGIELIYTPSINSKSLSQFFNSFFSFLHACLSDTDVVLVVNSANGPFGIFTKIFRKKTCINVDGLEWLRPKWKGLGSIYFKISTKLSTLFFDEVITDSVEMKNIYKSKFNKDSNMIAYGPTMSFDNSKESILKKYNIKKNEYYLIVGRLIPDNNSKIIIDGFVRSKSNKKLIIVGDVPYKDGYAASIKNIRNKQIIFTGYVKCNNHLSELYKNSFAYIHGHEFGGTNPTMINALYFNLEILGLDTPFNREMLIGKKSIFFKKDELSIINSIQKFEKQLISLKKENSNYKLPKHYKWNYITNKYLNLFYSLINK